MDLAKLEKFRWPEMQCELKTGSVGFQIISMEDSGRKRRYCDGVLSSNRSVCSFQSQEGSFTNGVVEQIDCRVERQSSDESMVRGIVTQLFKLGGPSDDPNFDPTSLNDDYIVAQAMDDSSSFYWVVYFTKRNRLLIAELEKTFSFIGRVAK